MSMSSMNTGNLNLPSLMYTFFLKPIYLGELAGSRIGVDVSIDRHRAIANQAPVAEVVALVEGCQPDLQVAWNGCHIKLVVDDRVILGLIDQGFEFRIASDRLDNLN